MSTQTSLVVTRSNLFFTFLFMGLISFGGVLPWAYRLLVDEKRWLTTEEFAEAFSVGQVLPGPNILNVSVMVGARFQGVGGVLSALSGLLLMPFAISVLLAMLYSRYGHWQVVQHIFRGTAAASAGLMVAMGLKMVMNQRKHMKHKAPWPLTGITLLAFIGSGLLGKPLLLVLAVLVPLSIGLAWMGKSRREQQL